MRYPIWNELCTETIGAYSLDNLPGCSQVCVSHDLFFESEHRGKGNGKRRHTDRLDAIKELGYDYALCTVDLKNAAQIRILTEAGWQCLAGFISSKTGNHVRIYGRRIEQ
ncbi:MAG: hypothetical protein E6Q97_36520 [Desulfurellales bacterium]|nr:MAG: hypothetical protein E6Q97_36520 [Desulfurellales bacterium]